MVPSRKLSLLAFFALFLAGLLVRPAIARAEGEANKPVAPNAAPPGEQPKIELENPVYDFGTVLEGQAVSHAFKFKNTGDGDLVVNRVQTSCGCTAAEPSSRRLKKGQEAEIAVTFDTRHQKGHRVRTITLFTNDAQMSAAAMTLQGDIKVEVEAAPSEISFDKVRMGSEQTRDVEVRYLGTGGEFKVASVTNNSPNIKVLQEPLDHKPGQKLKITLLKSMPIGPFDDTINIVTNREPLQVHVFGQVVGDLTLEPAQVSFGIVPKGQSVTRLLRLTNSGSKPVNITGVDSSSPAVTAIVEPLTPGKEYKIILQLKKGTPDGQLRGQLRVNTSLPDQAVLTIPFYGIIGSVEG